MNKIVILFLLPICLFCEGLIIPLNADKEATPTFTEIEPVFGSDFYINFSGQTFGVFYPVPLPAISISAINPSADKSTALEIGLDACVVAPEKGSGTFFKDCYELKILALRFLQPKKTPRHIFQVVLGLAQ